MFNEKLMILRKQRGISQEELGNILNVTRQTISKWELGETTPEMDKLIELSNFFEVSIDELVGKEVNYNTYKTFYEYKSKTKIGNLPLVHINVGRGKRVAKGIIAIGNIAKGIIAIGGIGMGLITVAGLGLGLITIAGLSIGLLLSIGGISVGTLAIGGIAVGLFAIGGVAIGIYTIGGISFARDIALGGYANGHIAIGNKTNGAVEFHKYATSSEIRNAINTELPKTWKVVEDIFVNIVK